MSTIIFFAVAAMVALFAVGLVLCLWREPRFRLLVSPIFARIKSLLRAHRSVRATRQLPDALLLLCNALKAGLALPQAVDLAASLLRPPLSQEFGRVAAQLRMGRDFDSAFASLADSIPTEDVTLLTQSVDVLRRTGGNLIETFSSLNATIAQRRRIEEKIRALTSQGVAQAITLLMLPWFLSASLFVLAPDFIRPLYSTRLGISLLALVFLLEAAGAVWLRKIVLIRI